MIHYRSLEDVTIHNAWLTIGVFDGVHRGHQEILRRLIAGARAAAAPAAVLTFEPHPAVILGRGDIKCLTMPDERAELLGALGVDALITEQFTASLSNVSASDFVARLKQHLGLRRLLIGYDFALGKGREGNASRLAEIGHELDYDLEVVEAVSDESGVISSTEIRKLVAVGSVAEAARLLGHFYGLRGPVIHGDGRGRRINIPTANIGYPRQKVIPTNGIYGCWAWVKAQKYRAAVNVGINPTFTPEKQTVSVEAYFLDFEGDVYGQEVKLEFVVRLRDELKFTSVEALVEQIWRDVDDVRRLLREG